MSKRSLMLSTAAIAVLTGTAFADTTISTSKSEAYTTGTKLSGNSGQENAGNITIASGGAVAIKAAQSALIVDSNNWILQQASVTNHDNTGAYGILVSMTANRDLSSASFTNTAGTTITGSGIYLDSASSTSVYGSGTGKVGIYLDGSGCALGVTCTYTGNINMATGATLSVTGDSSSAIIIGNATDGNTTGNTVLKGDLILGGATTVTSGSTSATSSALYGLLVYGTVNGNISVPSGGSLTTYGAGSKAMSIQGRGVSGSISIGGTLASATNVATNYNYNQKINTSTNPEASSALEVSTSVGGGIAILGPTTTGGTTATATVSMEGSGAAAVVISPALNSVVTSPTTPLTIGVYTADTANPGFSFYNRGSIAASFTNYNKSSMGMQVLGYSQYHTILSGGMFNSGSLSAASYTSGVGQSTSGINAVGLYIGDYVDFLEGSGKNPASGSNPSDQAALVVSGATSTTGGSITASVTGDRGGSAAAIYISTYANVPSIINTGTISAVATTTDATLSGNVSNSSNPLLAVAIHDASGTVRSIYNAGTISAQAGYTNGSSVGPLDNNTQSAAAILLGGSASSSSAAGVQILNHSSASRAATITGDIYFGTGLNQVLDLQGNGPTLASTVTGNVTYGMIPTGSTSGDRLHIGSYSYLTGIVTTQETVRGAGVQVDVDTHGFLSLENTTKALNATTVTVATGGTLTLGVNKSLTTSGVLAAQTVNFASDATLGVAYNSYVSASTNQFVLMTADSGQLHVSQSTLDSFNSATNRPYLLKTATMCITTASGCTRPANLPSGQDALVIQVATNSAAELGLTPGSVPFRPIVAGTGTSTFFDQANIALGAEDTLGSAFINGIYDAKQAQKAYNAMAPSIVGGTRAIAISITDSATGPVGARQRALRMYSKTPGDMTLWGVEFAQMIKDQGTGGTDPNTGYKTNPGFRDHGFGFSLGLDGGSPKYGWYGGALTFYGGDVNELARDAHQNQQWYLLSLYSAWRGTGLFLDTKLDAGYGNINGKRKLTLAITPTTYYQREADNKHAGALISGSVTTGATFAFGAFTLMPQMDLDALYLREEGYTEHNPGTTTVGDGFDLRVNQSYAKSLRLFAGLNARYDLKLWDDFFVQPEVRAGYRYDFLTDPAKIKAAFAYIDAPANSLGGPGNTFTLTGPDPSKGNLVLGGSLSTTTSSWTLGANFDLVRGSNGSFQQVGALHLVGRI